MSSAAPTRDPARAAHTRGRPRPPRTRPPARAFSGFPTELCMGRGQWGPRSGEDNLRASGSAAREEDAEWRRGQPFRRLPTKQAETALRTRQARLAPSPTLSRELTKPVFVALQPPEDPQACRDAGARPCSLTPHLTAPPLLTWATSGSPSRRAPAGAQNTGCEQPPGPLATLHRSCPRSGHVRTRSFP